MRPVDEEEVITTVTGCTKTKSSDFEDMSMDTVAKVVSVICKLLAHSCRPNISFRTGVFPSRMNIVKVIPMFKSGTKTDVTNYRPFYMEFGSSVVECRTRNQVSPGCVIFSLSMLRAWAVFNCLIWGFWVMG